MNHFNTKPFINYTVEWLSHPIDVRFNPAFLRQYRALYNTTRNDGDNKGDNDGEIDTEAELTTVSAMEVDGSTDNSGDVTADNKLMEALNTQIEIVNQ